MTRITLPFIDANIVDATVTAWRRQPGDPVDAGEPIVEVTTDKAAFDVEAPCGGTLLEILAAEKSVVPINFILGLIGATGETDPDAEQENATILQAYRDQVSLAAPTATPAPTSFGASAPPAAGTDGAPRVRATPKARRLAQTHGIDLTAIQKQTGVDLITEAVLEPFLPKPKA